MKKVLAMALALVMVIALATSCGTPTSTSPSPSPSASEAASPSAAVSTEPSIEPVKWPTGNAVSFDVAAKAGGGSDMIARYITGAWDETLDASFVVTNYDTGEVGSQHTINAAPDGMTLTLLSVQSLDLYLTGATDIHPLEDYTVIAKVLAGGPQVIITNSDAPYNNMKEFEEYALAHPEEIVAGVALGGTSHLMWLRIVQSMGGDVKLNYVQSASESDKLTNVASGSINVGNVSLNNAKAYEADGKVKILGIVSYDDSVGKNDIDPTLGDQYLTTAEQGYPGSSFVAGTYIAGPAGMDPALVEAINKSIQGIAGVQSLVDGMAKMGQAIEIKSPAESQADYAAEYEIQKELIIAAGTYTRE